MKMVEYMKRAFGDMLLSDYLEGELNRQQLPSPEVGTTVHHNILLRVECNVQCGCFMLAGAETYNSHQK